MARILITSGPTRQYLDPVRYLSNASSGRMGAALAQAALRREHDVTLVSGPVAIAYPSGCQVIPVQTTQEMMDACLRHFEDADGVIGAAAPCDYQPREIETSKMAKTGGPRTLELVETPDIIATLGAQKKHQWVVGFALETDDHHFHAISKLERKCCDLIVLNRPSAMNAVENSIEVLDRAGEVLLQCSGAKSDVAHRLVELIHSRLIDARAVPPTNG